MKGADDGKGQDDPWGIAWEDIEMQGKEIGRGQFGAVFHGLLFGTEVALKKLLKLTEAEADVHQVVLNGRDLATHEVVDTKYMKREQEMLRQLAHPNICLFIGLCAHEGDLWLVSEYVANGCLSKLLYDTSQSLTWSRRVRFALDVTQALAFIHSKQLMHRDVKAPFLLCLRCRV
jgi:LIM domain kinase 1